MNGRFGAYLAAHFGKSLLWTGGDLLTIYLLVNVHAMAPAFAGALFFSGLVVNAAADWTVGRLLSTRPFWARRVAIGGLVVAAMAFPASMWFAPGRGWVGVAVPVMATLMFRGAYAAYDVPHNSLMGSLAGNVAEASLLARGRTLGTGAAALVLGLGLNWSIAAGALTAMLVAVALCSVALGSAAIPLLAPSSGKVAGEGPATSIGMDLPWRFLAAVLLFDIGAGALVKGLLHMPADRALPEAGAIVMMLTIGRLASSLYPFRNRSGGKGLRDLALINSITGIGMTAFAFACNAPMIFLLGLAIGTANLNNWTLLARFSRSPGTFGLFAMSSKVALGIAGLLMSAILGSAARFDEGRLICLLAVAAACCLAGGIILGFRGISLPSFSDRDATRR